MKKKFKKGVHQVGPGNYYGGLYMMYDEYNDKWYWAVENWDGKDWREIPLYLAEALAKFNNGDK